MMNEPPMIRRARRGQPAAAERPTNPLGGAIGFIVAGAWSLWTTTWLSMPSWTSTVLTVLGILAIFFGLLLTGSGIGQLLNRRHHD